MSRNLLHVNKLDAFKAWMTSVGIEHRPGRGGYEVLQIKTKKGAWQCVFRRAEMPEHYTVAHPIEPIVRRFINDNRSRERESEQSNADPT
ncbi:hypothetical protein [Paraburkholderia caribensis]|uniref:hypothetical protein n=1 Tax=Paraburkholderia caribensis TaxID=75105 RepID=UPI001CB50364|nr:hypothetical protein [Paraburkholderia caribensis]CAG9255838.1 conserved hypothetical protein [Paraburkholderia caribensis]